MVFTEIQRLRLKMILEYYSGKISNVPLDETKINTVLFGSDEEKLLLISNFEKDILKPNLINSKTQLETALTNVTNKLSELN